MLVVEVQTTPPVLIAVCYCKPSDDNVLDRTMTALHSVSVRYPFGRLIAIGDFNIPEIKWVPSGGGVAAAAGDHRLPQRAAAFLDHCALSGLSQHVFVPTRGDNILDLVLSRRLKVDVVVHDGTFHSDHKELVCAVRFAKVAIPLVTRTSAFNYKRADFEGMKRSLE